MPDTVFPYPGGKSKLAKWIVSNMPEHHCYIEPFGGGAGLLLNKPQSEVEAYNDLDNDLYQFFHTLRNYPDALIRWLNYTQFNVDGEEIEIEAPLLFSEKLHSDWVDDFYEGNHPDDPIERAGRFFFLRFTQWGSKYHGNSGFAFSKKSSDAKGFHNAIERLERLTKRFKGVYIHNRNWKKFINMYDGEDTLIYCDPPYLGTEDHYKVTGFDHQKFITHLDNIKGKFMLSYNELPNGIEDYNWYMLTKDSKFYIGNGKKGESRGLEEKLIMNFDPENTTKFHSAGQSTITNMMGNGHEDDENENDELFDDFLDEDNEEQNSKSGFKGFLEEV